VPLCVFLDSLVVETNCGHPGAVLPEEGVINHCRQHLASYKKPTPVVFVEELPKGTFGGKILKRVLREKYGKQ